MCKALYKPDNNNNTSAVKKQIFEVGKNYAFDITKADQIFDVLLADKVIRLSDGHKNPKAEDLKGKEYCKWQNSWRHSTNNCVVFHNIIQANVENGVLKFSDKTMGVDVNLFLDVVGSHMVLPDLTKLSKSRGKADLETSREATSRKRPDRKLNIDI